MKHFKLVLGLLGAILIIPILLFVMRILMIIFTFIANLEIVNLIANMIVYLCLGLVVFIIAVGGYCATVEFLEKHFKWFNKK
jgi:hypothetical protein